TAPQLIDLRAQLLEAHGAALLQHTDPARARVEDKRQQRQYYGQCAEGEAVRGSKQHAGPERASRDAHGDPVERQPQPPSRAPIARPLEAAQRVLAIAQRAGFRFGARLHFPDLLEVRAQVPERPPTHVDVGIAGAALLRQFLTRLGGQRAQALARVAEPLLGRGAGRARELGALAPAAQGDAAFAGQLLDQPRHFGLAAEPFDAGAQRPLELGETRPRGADLEQLRAVDRQRIVQPQRLGHMLFEPAFAPAPLRLASSFQFAETPAGCAHRALRALAVLVDGVDTRV